VEETQIKKGNKVFYTWSRNTRHLRSGVENQNNVVLLGQSFSNLYSQGEEMALRLQGINKQDSYHPSSCRALTVKRAH
jgi:hypothetical protein